MTKILDSIDSPDDVKGLSHSQLVTLAGEIREELVSVVSKNGGHLASNLGVVELSIALHRVFNSPDDKIVWDVGHQAYTHKLLTGRRASFETLRQYQGLSGFTCRAESAHDPFGAGHASTSVSAALGMAIARDLSKDDYHVIAVIGDGAITGGMALEALNQAGHLGSRLIVVLNDNGMSISPTVGALAKLMRRVRFNQHYRDVKETSWRILRHFPLSNKLWIASRQVESGMKGLMMPTTLWEELGFAYMGPVNGHNLRDLEMALQQAKEYPGRPILLHVATTKGKGYDPAEGDAVYFHGVPAKNSHHSDAPTYSEVFAQTTLELVRNDPRIVVITPAMPEGNCLTEVQAEFPDRVFDVGICEQHAVTFAAGLATQGYIPIIAIYSTFLQRAFDQIIHDVCLQDLPMVFAIDRGGIVGDDGKTHQGTFDLSYLSMVPNMIVSAPKDEEELRHLLYSAVQQKHPMAIRYPRSAGLGVSLSDGLHEIPVGSGEILRDGEDIAIFAIGATVDESLTVAGELAKMNIGATVVNTRFAKPLPTDLISDIAGKIKYFLTIEENVLPGGLGNNIAQFINDSGFSDVQVKSIGVPDEFIEHGTQTLLREKIGLDSRGIIRQFLEAFPEFAVRVPVKNRETLNTPSA